MNKDVIALVGAGAGGCSILRYLLEMPGVEVRYVVDIDPDAPGMALAKEQGLRCLDSPAEIVIDPEVDLILEVTGKKEVFERVNAIKPQDTILIGASGTKIIFHFLEAQNQVNLKLHEYQSTLEAKIIERTEQLAQTNEKLQKQIYEYEGLNRELQQINEEKTKYLIQATHQLKAPFAAIQSYADVLLEGFAGPVSKPVMDIVKKIKKRCVLLTSSIHEMLELASLNTVVRDTLKMTPVSINDVITATIQHYKDVAKGRNIQIKFTRSQEKFRVMGIRDQLATLFAVLLDNAINYSNDNSQVEFVLNRGSDKWLEISVKDHGIGIPEENQGKIFKEYFRSNNAVAKHENGSGLGLAIVKRISDLHNFSIIVESQLGKGTVFTLTMPLVATPNDSLSPLTT